MTDKQSFADQLRDAAIAEQHRIGTRDRAVADIIRGNSRDRISEIVVIEDGDGATTGAFVAQVESRLGEPTWQAVNDGKRLLMGWPNRALAVLHLLSVRYGDGDGRGTGAVYAARVLGITVAGEA